MSRILLRSNVCVQVFVKCPYDNLVHTPWWYLSPRWWFYPPSLLCRPSQGVPYWQPCRPYKPLFPSISVNKTKTQKIINTILTVATNRQLSLSYSSFLHSLFPHFAYFSLHTVILSRSSTHLTSKLTFSTIPSSCTSLLSFLLNTYHSSLLWILKISVLFRLAVNSLSVSTEYSVSKLSTLAPHTQPAGVVGKVTGDVVKRAIS
eukprot:TRINITY_DN204_c1_g1_i5.p1 TRINITY_DN204_c1_g1~~TRINITY_DN204_c1_g1_i5.p1  ORF type:complete len:204 (+),score=1.87 TRINITY_DN204_c1_g1_i5:536-1147(+)